jgi:hypothetical protein
MNDLNITKQKSSIDISNLLMCVEKEKEWLYIFNVVKWFQDNIYIYTKQYGKNSYMVNRFIICMKQNKYCLMWALRRLLFEWGIDGSYKDIRKGIKNRAQSKLLISNLINKLDLLWITPVERGVKNMSSFLFNDYKTLKI